MSRLPLVRGALRGHITLDAAMESFGLCGAQIERLRPAVDAAGQAKRVLMVLDASGITGYDPAARDWFLQVWARRYGSMVSRLAVVTRDQKFRLTIVAVGLVTRALGMRVRHFDAEPEALA